MKQSHRKERKQQIIEDILSSSFFFFEGDFFSPEAGSPFFRAFDGEFCGDSFSFALIPFFFEEVDCGTSVCRFFCLAKVTSSPSTISEQPDPDHTAIPVEFFSEDLVGVLRSFDIVSGRTKKNLSHVSMSKF
jgi:hypothetical protein